MRRLFRRHIRKTLAQEVPPILQDANFAFDKGEYGRAGELFEKSQKRQLPVAVHACPLLSASGARPRFCGTDCARHAVPEART